MSCLRLHAAAMQKYIKKTRYLPKPPKNYGTLPASRFSCASCPRKLIMAAGWGVSFLLTFSRFHADFL